MGQCVFVVVPNRCGLAYPGCGRGFRPEADIDRARQQAHTNISVLLKCGKWSAFANQAI